MTPLKHQLKNPKPDKEEKQELLVQVKEELDKEKARKRSLQEAGYAGTVQGTGYSYINPFAIALGANNIIIALLSAVPWTIGPIAQLFGARHIEKNRVKTLVKYMFIEIIFWLALFAFSLLVWLNKIPNPSIILLPLYALIIILHGLGYPSWFSWIGDIIPEKIRGRFFSKRNRITGTLSLSTMLAASFLLDFFKTKGIVFAGFSLLFLIATIARIIATLSYKKQYEPKQKISKLKNFSIIKYAKNLTKDNLGKFTLFTTLMKFSAFIASPFFAVYMLKDLNLSYLWFTLITISATLFTLASIELWGRFGDKYGNKLLLKIGGVLVPLGPLLWIISPNPYYLIFVPQAIMGIGWAAFNLGINDFFFDATTPEKRPILIAYHHLLVGTGILIGGLVGSLIINYLPITFMNNILFIFLVSGVLRALTTLIFLPKIQETKHYRKPRKITTAIIKEIKPLDIEGLIHTPDWFNYNILKKVIKPKQDISK